MVMHSLPITEAMHIQLSPFVIVTGTFFFEFGNSLTALEIMCLIFAMDTLAELVIVTDCVRFTGVILLSIS